MRSVIAVIFSLWAGLAWALQNPGPVLIVNPAISYSGTQVMTVDGNTVTMTIHHAPDKDRREMVQGGQTVVSILRYDQQVMWVLFGGNYLEMPLNADTGAVDISSSEVEGMAEYRAVGQETVGGQATTKYKILVRNDDGGRTEGLVWATDDGIVMRSELDQYRNGGAPTRIEMALRDLRIGPQDPSLFELPAGASPMGRLGGMGAAPSAPPQPATPATRGPAEQPSLAEQAGERATDSAEEEVLDGVENAVRQGLGRLFGR